MKPIQKLLAAPIVLAGGLALSQAALAGSSNCPTGVDLTNNTNYVQFTDANSYSLPILGLDVNSSPGQIGGCIIITSGPNGVLVNNGGGTVMDNAYNNEQGGTQPYFQTGTANAPDPGGVNPEFAGDQPNTWDIQVAALNEFLNGGAPIFYFNHNQTNSGDAVNQDLFIWAQISITDVSGNVLLVCTLQSQPSGLPGDLAFNFGTPGGTPSGDCSQPLVGTGFPTTDQFVRARGAICLAAPGTPGSEIVPCGSDLAVKTFNENLGADQVADAIVVPTLSTFLANAATNGAFAMHVDLRMGCSETGIGASQEYLPPDSQYINPDGSCPLGSPTNNGFEQLFIVSGNTPVILPEPQTLALFALGLVAMGWATRRSRKQ
jgi:hypothetical protein